MCRYGNPVDMDDQSFEALLEETAKLDDVTIKEDKGKNCTEKSTR